MKTLAAVLGAIILAVFIWNGAAVVVNENQMAVVLEFGRLTKEISEPGLYWKTPFVQNVTFLDKRVQLYDVKPEDIITKDKKTLHVDNYTVWRIVDPIKFITTVQSVVGAQTRLDDVVYSELRAALGQYDFIDVIGEARERIHETVTRQSNLTTKSAFGIEILDVRIKRADLPKENQEAVFARMKSERQRQATQYKSEGAEESAKIKAQTDKEKAIILAEANQKAQTIRGEGEGEAIRIYKETLQQDPEFYTFIRSLEAYRKSLTGDKKHFILSPNDPLFKYLLGAH